MTSTFLHHWHSLTGCYSQEYLQDWYVGLMLECTDQSSCVHNICLRSGQPLCMYSSRKPYWPHNPRLLRHYTRLSHTPLHRSWNKRERERRVHRQTSAAWPFCFVESIKMHFKVARGPCCWVLLQPSNECSADRQNNVDTASATLGVNQIWSGMLCAPPPKGSVYCRKAVLQGYLPSKYWQNGAEHARLAQLQINLSYCIQGADLGSQQTHSCLCYATSGSICKNTLCTVQKLPAKATFCDHIKQQHDRWGNKAWGVYYEVRPWKASLRVCFAVP